MQETTNSPVESQKLAIDLLKKHPETNLWLLEGDLGVGKTTIVKGLAEHFGLKPEQIKSPTFTYVNHTELPNSERSIAHYDLYRLEEPDAFIEAMIEEDIQLGNLVLVEWPERMPSLKSYKHLELRVTHLNENQRKFQASHSEL